MRGWLTTAEAARLLRALHARDERYSSFSAQLVRLQIRSGRLRAEWHGGSLVLARKDVRAFRLPKRGRPRKR